MYRRKRFIDRKKKTWTIGTKKKTFLGIRRETFSQLEDDNFPCLDQTADPRDPFAFDAKKRQLPVSDVDRQGNGRSCQRWQSCLLSQQHCRLLLDQERERPHACDSFKRQL